MIFKVFGGNDLAKTTPVPPSISVNDNRNNNNNNDPARLPPRVDPWPNNAWKNHHNDDASRSSDSTNIENDHFYKPNESFNNKNHNIGFGHPTTTRPFFINRENTNVNSNTNGGGTNNINKPTKKTSEFRIKIFINSAISSDMI